MKLGAAGNPGPDDLSLPDQPFAREAGTPVEDFAAYVGCSGWDRKELKNLFPKNTQDDLKYYSTQFNSVELNATFYHQFPASQFKEWKDRSAPGFVFFPKLSHEITHVARLRDFETPVDQFVERISILGEKLGAVFAQMHDTFGPQGFDRFEAFVKYWRESYKIPLAVDMRNAEWFSDDTFSPRFYRLLEDNDVTNIILDTAGRRDLIHMRLTMPIAFIRFVGCGIDDIDKRRLDTWAAKLAEWKSNGLTELYFFVHQHEGRDSPMLAAYFIENFNAATGLNLPGPSILNLKLKGLDP